MGEIEPDLLKENIESLEEKYANENNEQQATRFARYQSAFVEYNKRRDQYFAELSRQVDAYCTAITQQNEQQSRLEEQEHLDELESLLATA